MSKINSIEDIKTLFQENNVFMLIEYDKVLIFMNPNDEKLKKTQPTEQIEYVGNGSIDEPTGTNFKRLTKNTIASLVNNPQFIRCTTVAHFLGCLHLTEFGKSLGIKKITKNKGEPLTLLFEDPSKSFNFMKECLKNVRVS